jgi:hypothetical protein
MSEDEYLLISTTLLPGLHIKREAIQVICELFHQVLTVSREMFTGLNAEGREVYRTLNS